MNSFSIFRDLSEHIVLRINSCREVHHLSGWIETKQHHDYDLWYVQEGQIEIRTNDSVHLASAGDLVLFNPKVAYTASNLGDDCRFIYTHFDFGLGDQLRILDQFQLAGVIASTLVPEEISLFLKAYKEHQLGSSMSGIHLKGCLTILVAKILECYERGEYVGQFANPAPERKRITSLQSLQPVLDHIQEQLHMPLRARELAVMAGMSEKYFISYFKQALGITPGLYIYQLKMNRARELLYSKQYTIQQIAGMLGYPDPYSFSKAFKKYYNVPPSKFD
ncbi:AraC family transcriptional regulator [Paenibacillus sp. PDC88]|uniref:AraC family transcriptional regulator n=1 Tax=Paenibacillus sp. PDC88 TaxID=1884375 RepID=UPI00089D5A41|nr:AraC family transcriptional regulator [Paenibacillus sp. PDC88]SDW02729.1 AraC-type DNA-binding protein [Paenibacillus sp. PDC88]